ncbi:glycoside hydrolase family 35 protein [Auriculariales sp. MPI-PUGE-AT-0066]|nr:glycoside hydrolase family 35 protein [Auriculariales sp. MPI-PUGE-AT-0066]
MSDPPRNTTTPSPPPLKAEKQLQPGAKAGVQIITPSPAARVLNRSNLIVFLLLSCFVVAGHWALHSPRAHRTFSPVSSHGSVSARLSDNGLTDVVQWDKYSLFVHGQRIFMWSGEFHTFRLPVPSLWADILDKMKAAGLNSVSIYVDWALVNPSPGVFDFDTWRALTPFLDACMAAGLFVVFRPGAYINAEVNGGGIPAWVTSEIKGHLRSNDSDWADVWRPYMHEIIKQTRSYQITHGGPIIAWQIENEYTANPNVGSPGKTEYMEQLESFVRENGIVVPLTFNEAGRGQNFVNGSAAVDIYGFDAYPQRFDCANPDVWIPLETDYRSYHEATNPSQPLYIPEFQAGAFDPWGPGAPTYDKCRILTGPEFEAVFNKHLIASGATMINFYMMYGGTSWGSMPFPGVYTSYDYGSPITENRSLSAKYTELKRQGLFVRSAPELYKTDYKGNSTDGSGAVLVDNPDILATALINPDSHAGFWIVRHADSVSSIDSSFHLTVKTTAGRLTLPQSGNTIQLSGRQSKIIVTDFKFGSSRALYSTAEVLFAGKIGDRDVLFLHGDPRHWHETSIAFTGRSTGPRVSAQHLPMMSFAADQNSGQTIVTVLPGLTGMVTLWDSELQLVVYADTETAGTFFAPVLAVDIDLDPFGNFWSIGTNATLLVGGPYLVRSATLQQGGQHLALTGDLKEEVLLTLIAPPEVKDFSWNGVMIENVVPQAGESSVRTSFLVIQRTTRTASSVVPSEFHEWTFHDGLPEIQDRYDDAPWTTADHKETNIPYKPHFGAPPVLYGCDYEFCEGTVLWRGHFQGSDETTGVNLTINGGEAFAASVWINGRFIKTTYGNSTNNLNIIRETNEVYAFPQGSVRIGKENVITVLQDNQGLEETEDWEADTSKSPRGIRGAGLIGGKLSHWKVQGKQGGYTKFADRLHGISNEGGTFGERHGWHVPGFEALLSTGWTSRSLSSGLPHGAAGVGVFITHFELDVPPGVDLPMSFVFDDGVGNTGKAYRAYLYVNGWMMGKRVANLGPQAKFPVHEGILDYHGENTVVVVLWAMEKDDGIAPALRIVVDGTYETGMGEVAIQRSKWAPRMNAA